ncbi:MAG TPA: DNA-formamidopyrimidine glycosylase family protein [Sporichthyaceae bacterium]|jgi:formamidopyrimidine-DNA glycosylase|nr:DNA-formamidopyrimidine glycosylase family protein [Sporichthyaceae bacterium]
MPELPEVEALRRLLAQRAVGRAVVGVDVAAFSALKTYDPPVTALPGLFVCGVARHGKFLDLAVGGTSVADAPFHLVVHLARAGWLAWRENLPAGPARPGKGPLAMRVRLGPLEDDPPTASVGFDLTEAGTKKGLAVYCVRDPLEVPGVARLGPDPLDPAFTAEVLGGVLAAAGRAQLKGVLRDQSLIAGIGNAYSDEVLHAARLSPFKPAASLDPAGVAELHAVIRATLADAIGRAEGLATSELKGEKKAGLRVHARAGQPCPVCGDTVREVSFSDSSLQYCPTCQTGGKPLADRRLSRLLK